MPSSGVGGATNQSLPNASFAPASISDRNAYVVLILRADVLLGPPAVVDGVVRLHARDHAQRRKARDVGGCQVLRVLDAEATVARAVLARDAVVDVEQQRDWHGRRWRAPSRAGRLCRRRRSRRRGLRAC